MRSVLWIACAIVAALLVVNVAYCWRGSLEMFPTEEQQDKIRTATMVFGVVLAAIEAGLLWLVTRRG